MRDKFCRRICTVGIGAVAGLLTIAGSQAVAMTPSVINIDGGPLGQLQVSGGVDGFAYYISGTNPDGNLPGSFFAPDNKSNGAYVGSALVQLQKATGILQFTLEIGANGGGVVLGLPPSNTSVNTLSTGPLYAGNITIAPPNSPVTISAGMLNSVEGVEYGTDWSNVSQLNTALYYMQNSQNRGINAVYIGGPIYAVVQFGDGYDTGVFNFVQALFTYTIDQNNIANVYYGGNLGRTGLNARTYGGITQQEFGPQYVNSQLIGAFYGYTVGDLTLTPEAQFQFAKADEKIGLTKSTSNFGAAMFGNYLFGKSPYSIGGWAEYYSSHSSAADNTDWFVGPDSQAVGVSVVPTWQYKDLFVRADAGYLYLLHDTDAQGNRYGYGSDNDTRGVFTGTLEAGLLF